MALGDSVRAHGRHIAAEARSVRIDLDALEALDPGDPPQLDPQRHYLEGPAADVADYVLVLDAINFGSGWFPTLRKRAGSSGYFTVAWAIADRFRAHGPWTPAPLRALGTGELAGGMALFADRGFYKRAQIVPADLALAGVARFKDLHRLTIFADNLVPHVLRCDSVLHSDDALAAHIDAGRLLPPGPQEREIRACAVHACELIAARLG